MTQLQFSLREIALASIILSGVVDIAGRIPIIMNLNGKVGHIQSGKATIVAACSIIALLFIGEEFLKLIGIDVNSFAVILDGILTFLLALQAENRVENIIVAIIFNVIFVYLVLKSSSNIEKSLGKSSLGISKNGLGVILLAMAAK